jgi:hypothetical protein
MPLRAQQEDVGVGAARHRDALAAKILDLMDGRILEGDERGPFRLRVDVDGLDRHAVRLAEERGGAGRGAEIDAVAVQEFERLVAAETQHPFDLGAVLRELLLHPAFVAEYETHRAVIGPVDAQRRNLVGGTGGREPGSGRRNEGQRDDKGARKQKPHDPISSTRPNPARGQKRSPPQL